MTSDSASLYALRLGVLARAVMYAFKDVLNTIDGKPAEGFVPSHGSLRAATAIPELVEPIRWWVRRLQEVLSEQTDTELRIAKELISAAGWFAYGQSATRFYEAERAGASGPKVPDSVGAIKFGIDPAGSSDEVAVLPISVELLLNGDPTEDGITAFARLLRDAHLLDTILTAYAGKDEIELHTAIVESETVKKSDNPWAFVQHVLNEKGTNSLYVKPALAALCQDVLLELAQKRMTSATASYLGVPNPVNVNLVVDPETWRRATGEDLAAEADHTRDIADTAHDNRIDEVRRLKDELRRESNRAKALEDQANDLARAVEAERRRANDLEVKIEGIRSAILQPISRL